jgi:hypothetical protein
MSDQHPLVITATGDPNAAASLLKIFPNPTSFDYLFCTGKQGKPISHDRAVFTASGALIIPGRVFTT